MHRITGQAEDRCGELRILRFRGLDGSPPQDHLGEFPWRSDADATPAPWFNPAVHGANRGSRLWETFQLSAMPGERAADGAWILQADDSGRRVRWSDPDTAVSVPGVPADRVAVAGMGVAVYAFQHSSDRADGESPLDGETGL